ncbi:ABC transporter substrate-binding protein [Actinocatenispora rupis]|uniref:Sugar ABC transporter substrate-binding protein n=1 Tax=Actinocatenispora rupis TaxID=519421 RepID=A0A8J3NEP6_9ACTN|nr:extracellular solute-binding protein [Actinocatenispora rupis]GID14302.1 sugar ABC transporter substrate-binding protein [Actinocatenispora rupis]
MNAGAVSRRTLLAGSAAAAAGLGVAGCSSSDSGGSAPKAKERKPGQKITLTFWAWVPGIDKAVDLWNSQNPDVQVKLEKVSPSGGAQYAKMHAALKAGNPPDVAQVEFQVIPDFLLDNGLVDLAKYGIAKDKDKFVDWQWQQGVFGSSVYAVPQASGPMGLFYRKDLFDKWGIAVPTTWDEYAAAAKKVRKADPKAYISTFPPANGGWFTGLAWQAGAKWFDTHGDTWTIDIDNAETRKVAEYWEGLIKQGLVSTEPDQQDSWFADVQHGRIVAWPSAQWGDAILSGNAEPTKGKWRAAPIPVWDKAKPISANWGGSTTALLRGGNYITDALKFAVWLNTDPKSIDLLIAGGYGWPAAKGAFAGSALDKPSPFFGGQKYNTVFAASDKLIDKSWKWIPTIQATYKHLGDEFTKAINDKTSFATAIANVQKATVADMKAKGLKVA